MGRKEKLKEAKVIFDIEIQSIVNETDKWRQFLDFSSKFYKYSFSEKLLMFAQRDDVTMCATLEEWNSIGRWVKPKSKGIKVLEDSEDEMSLKYVFDVTDTYARNGIPNAYTDEKLKQFKWTATEEQVIDILSEYLHYENIDKLEYIVASYVGTALDDKGLLNNLSEEEEALVLSSAFVECLIKSTTYQIATRCGIEIKDIDRMFAEFENINNIVTFNILGNCVNSCSSDLLKIIEYKIKERKKEELNYGIRQVWNNIEKESKGTLSNEVQSINNRGNIDGKIGGERTRDIETEESNRGESEKSESTTKNKRVYSDGEVQSDDRESGGRNVTTDDGRKDLEVEQSTSFSLPKNEVSEELITEVLSQGGNIENSLGRIKDFLSDNTLSVKEQIIEMRKEYGDAGAGLGKYDWNSRAKGITITDNTTKAEITLSWADVVKRMKKIMQIENEQLGFDTLLELSYKQDDVIETKDNTKEHFVADLLGKDVILDGRNYKVDKVKFSNNTVELYDKDVKGWYPIFREMDLDEFYNLYQKKYSEKQDEETLDKINYKIPNETTEKTNLRQKCNDNIEAIKLLKQIESENRLATAEEQKILAKYNGWGGLARVFDTRAGEWQVQEIELKQILTEDEMKEAKASVLNAFYTEPFIIDNMYKALEKLGFKGGNILEPSARSR